MRIFPSRYKVHKIYGRSLITENRKMGRKNFFCGFYLHDKKSKIRISPSRIIDFFIRISPSRIQRSMIIGPHSDQLFTIKSPANLNNSPSRYKVHKIYGQSLITDYRKMGRKNFSFGLALHDKKSKIRISPSRIIDFSFDQPFKDPKANDHRP